MRLRREADLLEDAARNQALYRVRRDPEETGRLASTDQNVCCGLIAHT